jgi:DNA invertase Pin-like site-specific DNA recombinase
MTHRKERHIAVYVRVSTSRQDTRSQEPDLQAWVKAYAGEIPVRWYRDKASGRSMVRPGWTSLEAELAAGRVARVVVWRVDRLGRTAAGLVSLFEDLARRGVGLVSVRDGLDLETPAGRLLANVMASVAAYETEVRGERQAAGIAAAKAAGVTWGGRKAGDRYKVKPELRDAILREAAAKTPKAAIARLLGISRPTVYSVLAETAG